MRLTLRTLLAYLDDILEPLEIKTIGQKVAESETAQELIARIKQVTRRRRITTPPATGPNSFEPNMVAEYLDNELSPEQVAELEKVCLESDVHLAEVASCHQILTLVLGEPAVVPPTAKERMYALVQGREAIPFRKATSSGHASAPTSADADADEMFLLGLPFYRRGSWLRWALPLAALLLFAIVGVALWQTINGVQQPNSVAQATSSKSNAADKSAKTDANAEAKAVNPLNNVPANAESKNEGKNPPDAPRNPANTSPDEKQPKTEPNVRPDSTGGSQTEVNKGNPPPTGKLEKTQDNISAPPISERQAPPSKERVDVGQYYNPGFSPKSLLVQRGDKDGWSRPKPTDARVHTGAQLMSLPGYASEIRLDCGIHLLLRGLVREFTPPDREALTLNYLQECAIVLHKPPKDTAVDLTLLRGRLYLSNHKGKDTEALVVRLRFENKVWDLTLYPDAEVIIDLFKSRIGGTDEPLSVLKLFLLKGEAGIALDHDRYPDLSDAGRAQFFWSSLAPAAYERPKLSPEELNYANRVLFPKNPIVEARDMESALKAVRDLMTVDKAPQVALQEALGTTGNAHFSEHQLALYCLAALDEVKDLLDVLGKADVIYAPDRDTAVFALKRWLDHGPGQSKKLFDLDSGKGLLRSDLGYTTEEAKRIVSLLRDPANEDILSPTYYTELAADLASDKVAIAELARWWLSRLVLMMFHLDLPKLKQFNAAWPQDRRLAARKEVEQAIRDGLLPPPEPGKPRTPPGGQQLPKGGINPGSKQR